MIAKWLEQAWYHPKKSPIWWLIPLSILFGLISRIRRYLYQKQLLTSTKLPVPTIIVGNITVGGNGKTPLVIALVNYLKQLGYQPGVISRGYGGNSTIYPLIVTEKTAVQACGDEPWMIQQQTQCPVVVAPDRVAAGQYLLVHHQCNIIISDDGLQHYALQRDIEIIVINSQRQLGNRWLLPAGPLRESASRLQQADWIFYNAAYDESELGFIMQPVGLFGFQATTALPPKKAHFISGIANPERFLQSAKAYGLSELSVTIKSDHHQFTATDFTQYGDEAVVMTEKDAVKCHHFAQQNWWYLAVEAQLTPASQHIIKQTVKKMVQNYGI